MEELKNKKIVPLLMGSTFVYLFIDLILSNQINKIPLLTVFYFLFMAAFWAPKIKEKNYNLPKILPKESFFPLAIAFVINMFLFAKNIQGVLQFGNTTYFTSFSIILLILLLYYQILYGYPEVKLHE